MIMLLKKDEKTVKITKKTLTILVQRLQPYIKNFNKNNNYKKGILLVILK